MPLRRIEREPWADKFQQPSVAQLRGEMTKEIAAVFDQMREHLLSSGELVESVSWQGVPWRWTLVYSLRGEESIGRGSGGARGAEAVAGRAWAYVVPDPRNLRLCVTLTAEQIQAMDLRRLKKWVRDGIAFAQAVGGVCWPTYALATKVQADDLMELVDRKSRVAMGEAQAVGA